MLIGEALKFSVQALRANPVRSLLTGLGMVIGTASVILVVTISLASRDYILEQVQDIGSNIIFAYYANAGGSAVADADRSEERRVGKGCRYGWSSWSLE